MKVLTVNSSMVNSLEFADTEQQIRVEFNRGTQYAYDAPNYETTKEYLIKEATSVEEGVQEASVGRLINSFIKSGDLTNAVRIW